MKYKSYKAKIGFSKKDKVFFGTIQGIEDTITFEAKSIKELKISFHEAVDDYIDFCKRIKKHIKM